MPELPLDPVAAAATPSQGTAAAATQTTAAAAGAPAPAAAAVVPDPAGALDAAALAALKAALVLPQGSPLDPTKAIERAAAWATGAKVTPEAAKAALEWANGEATELLTTYEAARAPGGAIHAETVKEQYAAALKDPALGNGDPAALERAQLKAGLVLNQYGQTGLADVVKARGYLLPAELKFLVAVHDAQGESKFVAGAGPRPAARNTSFYPEGLPPDTGAVAVGAGR